MVHTAAPKGVHGSHVGDVGDVGDVGHVLQIMVDRAVDANRTLFTERFRLQAVSCVQAV